MCNYLVSKTYLSKMLLPLYAIAMPLFDSVEGKHRQCAMENIYNLATFFRAAYNHNKKVLICGVTRKVMIGIPTCIKQEGFNSKKAQIDTMGTANAAFLRGGPKVTKLIEASVYDTKPFNYFIMVSEELKW